MNALEMDAERRSTPADVPVKRSEVSPVKAWLTVGMLFTLAIVSVLDRNIVTLLVGPIKEDFGIDDTQMSLLIGAAFAVPFGILSIPVGWLVDRYSRRGIIATGVTIWSLATIATGVVRTYAGMFFARSCVGAGDAMLAPANTSIIGDLFPRERLGLPMAIASMGFKAGQGAALIVGGALAMWIEPRAVYDVVLVGQIKGWQLMFLSVGVPGLIFIPLIFLLPEPWRKSPMGDAGFEPMGYRQYFRFVCDHWRIFIPHHVAVLLLIAMAYTIIAWMPAFLNRVHGWQESTAGSWLGAAFLLGPLLGMPIHGASADHLYRHGMKDAHLRYLIVSIMVGLPFGVAALLVPTPMAAVVCIGLFMFIISGYVSLPLTCLVTFMPNRLRGKAAAVVGLVCATTGTVLGPLLVGVITDRVFGDPAKVGMSIMICLLALAPVIIILMYRTLRHVRALGGFGNERGPG